MLLVRDIMHCKPGKVRPMVEKFLAMAKLVEKHGDGRMRGIMKGYHDLVDHGRREIYTIEDKPGGWASACCPVEAVLPFRNGSLRASEPGRGVLKARAHRGGEA